LPTTGFRVGPGSVDDLPVLLPLFDRAVEWLVERRQEGQWGSTPFSESAATAGHLRGLVAAGDLRVARAAGGAVVGGCVVGDAPSYAPALVEASRYLEAMVSDRRLAGRGIGSLLVADAVERTLAAGAEVLRADCWDGAPGLVRWYERQGFEAGDVVLVGAWPARMLARRV
jgi:GNAT superfamily N-acetyltransferase